MAPNDDINNLRKYLVKMFEAGKVVDSAQVWSNHREGLLQTVLPSLVFIRVKYEARKGSTNIFNVTVITNLNSFECVSKL